MFLAALLRHGLRLLAPVAVASTLYLYLYPFFLGCGFPIAPATSNTTAQTWASTPFLEAIRGHLPPSVSGAGPSRAAPFRLLALGDPQLEGDTSIPHAHGPRFPHLDSMIASLRSGSGSVRSRVRQSLHDLIDLVFDDIPDELESLRKRVDLVGNDYYLAHIYRTVDWWSDPTHVAVLGDLVGSQWIDDDEFALRSHRYWTRVMAGTARVPDNLALYPADEYDVAGYLGANDSMAAAWRRRVLNVAGNHDIGYAGDLTEARLERFERAFGKANYELRFEFPLDDVSKVFDAETNPESDRLVPELRVVLLNDMNLDTPALTQHLQDETYDFINKVIRTSTAVEFKGHATVLLTHVPLYKPEGVCIDDPFFDFFADDDDNGQGVKEQNQLSADASKGFLEGIFGMSGDGNAAGGGYGRQGVVLNGHDHEGCDTYHFINQSWVPDSVASAQKGNDGEEVERPKPAWQVKRWRRATADGVVGAPGVPGLREITVRSMMGDFGGNAGLLSAWFDEEAWEWRFEYATCALGRQHFWWAVHVLDAVVVGGAVLYGLLGVIGFVFASKNQSMGKKDGRREGKAMAVGSGKKASKM